MFSCLVWFGLLEVSAGQTRQVTQPTPFKNPPNVTWLANQTSLKSNLIQVQIHYPNKVVLSNSTD